MSKDIEILIVEEDLAQSDRLKHILEQHNHPVTVTHSGEQALAAMREHPPQIVISAVMLPLKDGYELCREIKADEQLKDIPVILLTSLSDTADIIRGMECGADNFVTKPYDEQLLMSRIEYIVLNRELRAGTGTQMGLEIIFGGQKYLVTPERQQMVDLLISTYETAVQKNLELLRVEGELNRLNAQLEEKVKERTAELAGEIAERGAAEVSLIESEERYRRLVELSPDMIAVHCEGRFVYVNVAGVKLLGATSSDELIGKPILDIVYPDDREIASSRIRQNLEGRQTPLIEQKVVRLDGQVIDVETMGIPTTYHDKPAAQIIIRDITERKRADEALLESEERYHNFFDENLGGAYISKPDGTLLTCNPAFARMFGFPSCDEVANHNLSEIYPSPKVREEFLELLREKGKIEYHELELRRSDGSPVHAIETVFGTFDEQGTLVEIKGYLLDNTEREQAKRSLTESESQLQQSQKMEAIGTLAGGVAHDFNNLLTVILGNIGLALRHLKPDDPAQLRLVEAEKAGNRAAILTRQLLAFGRQQHLERRTIDLNVTIGEIVKFLGRIIGEDVEVKVNAASDLSAVFADPAQLEQVVMNLCVNARDAMPQGGQLAIETSNVELDESYCRQYPDAQPGKYVEIMVSDTGTGMDRETQARIFEPFFTTKEVGKGTGLGLSMIYGIVKQHDGHVTVYSEVGRGTTFRVYLPVDEKAVEKEKQARQLPLLGGTETILVAEDEEALRRLSKDVLETLGYTVLIAKNGEEAVEMYAANRERIAMLLFDVVMPCMGGSEAFEQIHEMGGDVPLIFMTGYNSEMVQSRFFKQHELIEESGVVVIQKPCSLERLGRKVREVLDQKRGK